MPATQAQIKAVAKYKSKAYKRVPLDIRIEEYEQLKVAADTRGESVNGFIKEAIKQRIINNT